MEGAGSVEEVRRKRCQGSFQNSGGGARGVEGVGCGRPSPERSYSRRTRLSHCVRALPWKERRQHGWISTLFGLETPSNRASAPKGIDVAAPFLMCRKAKGTFRGQGKTLFANCEIFLSRCKLKIVARKAKKSFLLPSCLAEESCWDQGQSKQNNKRGGWTCPIPDQRGGGLVSTGVMTCLFILPKTPRESP